MKRKTLRIIAVILLLAGLSGCALSQKRTMTYYHANGKEQFRFDTVNGARTGRFVRWYEDGVKESECSEKSDQAQRKCSVWFPDGTQFSETEYSPDGSTGIEREWYSNSNPRSDGATKDRYREGIWHYWSRDGETQWDVLYRNGAVIDVYPPVEQCPQDDSDEAMVRKSNRKFLSVAWCEWEKSTDVPEQPAVESEEPLEDSPLIEEQMHGSTEIGGGDEAE